MAVSKSRKVKALALTPTARPTQTVKKPLSSNGDQPAVIASAQALPPEQRRDLFREISVSRHRSLGLVPERLYNPDELVGRRGLNIYTRMLTDDQVKAALTLKQHAVLSPGWDIEPASDSPQDLEVSEFVRFCLEDVEGSLDDDLLEIMTSLAYGYSLTELVFRPITHSQYQGKIGLRALKTRLPHDFVFVVDSHDNLLEDGIEQFGRRMPTAKFVIHSANKMWDNWYGTSDLRAAYRPWWFKENVLKWWAMFMDRYGIPLAEGIVPKGGALGDEVVTALRVALDNLQAATSIVHPDDITLAFPAVASATGSQIFVAAINAADQAIARALLLPNLLGVSAPADTGSFSQARKHFDVFILVVEKLQRDLADHVMGDQVIRRLVDLNYTVEDYPVFTFLPFTETDKGQLLSLWNQAIAAGAVQTRPEDEVHIRSITGFPEVPLEELLAEAEAKAAQEQATGGFPGGLGGPGEGELGGEGGFPSREGGSPGLEAPGGPGEGDLGGGGGENPTDEELDALIDEVLGAGAGKHRLAGRVAEALKGKKGKAFAEQEVDPEKGPSVEEPDEVSALLEQLEADHPEWDDDALVEAAVAELAGGSNGDIPEEEEEGEDLTDADLDGLLDDVLGGKADETEKTEATGEGEEEEAALPGEDEKEDGSIGAVDEEELDRLIAEALARRDGQDSEDSEEDGEDKGAAKKQGKVAKPFGAAVPLLKEGETLTSGAGGKSGVWRNIGGNPVFISVDVAAGESIPEAVRREVGKKGGAAGVAGGGRPAQAVSPDILTPGGQQAAPQDIGTVLAETPDAKTRKALVDADRSLSPEQKAALEDTELRHDSLPGEGAARWKPERRILHDRLLAEAEGTYQPSPERQAQRVAGMRPELVLMMGGPGSGKTSTMQEYLKVRNGDFLNVNADDFKLQLPEFGTVAGDDAVWKAASQTVHEESSYLSKALLARGFGRKADMVFDGTLGNVDKAIALAATAKGLGYRVSLHYVDAPMEVGLARTVRRAESKDRAQRRYVPKSFVQESYGKIGDSFERLRRDANVDSWAWYKVPAASAGAERFARGGRELPKPSAGMTPEQLRQPVGIETLTKRGRIHGR